MKVQHITYVKDLYNFSSKKWLTALEIKQKWSGLDIRFILNDYDRHSSVTDMLTTIGWESLESRRREARLCLLYKLHHGNMKVDVSKIICEPIVLYHGVITIKK